MTISTLENLQLNDRLIAELHTLEKVAKPLATFNTMLFSSKECPCLAKNLPFLTPICCFYCRRNIPEFPPIGYYLNYPWDSVGEGDHHFTRQSYYGAPFLSEEGWYWYCVGLGDGFNRDRWLNSWRPSIYPDKGHNLATLLVISNK